MDELESLKKELALVKARGFDLYEQLQQKSQYIQICEGALHEINKEVGVPVKDNFLDLNLLISEIKKLTVKIPNAEVSNA